jgi:hypothetical protein
MEKVADLAKNSAAVVGSPKYKKKLPSLLVR